MITEFTTVKASYELMNKVYRRNHREIEKGVVAIGKSLDELETTNDVPKAMELLQRVATNIGGSKRKSDSLYAEELKLILAAKRRIEHINQISALEKKSTQSVEDDAPTPGQKPTQSGFEGRTVPMNHAACLTRFHRHLADHLFARGYTKAALKLARSRPELGELCLIELFEEAISIEDTLRQGNTGPSHAWLQEVNFKLRRNETNSQTQFEFDLRVFEFYLLVREGKPMEAVQHARKYMSSVKKLDDYRATKLCQAMILLAMRTPEELQTKAKENNLTEDWIVRRAHEVLLDFYCFSPHTSFQLLVNAGISVIKTHHCFDSKSQHRDCAVCHPLINQLAVRLPFGRHDHSVLTCFQTGLPMDEHNPPMSLPNGYVYSQQGITELTDTSGMVTCPRSGEKFESSQVQRVYIV